MWKFSISYIIPVNPKLQMGDCYQKAQAQDQVLWRFSWKNMYLLELCTVYSADDPTDLKAARVNSVTIAGLPHFCFSL